ncbi:MAG: hypothetical protein QM503_00050 [Bacteroidota bacterium]
MIQRFRNSKAAKPISIFLLLTFLSTFATPTTVYALTGGPSQPEVQNFTPVSTSEMVDLFSGDFSYNIPLMDVGGYPINLSYQSGITMDQEASWVGLGWNLNPGSILRNMRGLPDDFSGDEVTKEQNMKANRTFGCTTGAGIEVAGLNGLINVGLSAHQGLTFNNYTGLGFERSVGFSFKAGSSGKLTGSLGLKSSTRSGLDINARIGLSSSLDKNTLSELNAGLSAGSSYNARQGIKDVTFSSSLSNSSTRHTYFSGKSAINFAANAYIPQIQIPYESSSYMFSLKAGATIYTFDATFDLSGYVSEQIIRDKLIKVPAYGYMYTHDGFTNPQALLDFNREKDGVFSRNTPALPLSNFTYDTYSINGQGISGAYRPYRSDIGYLFDRSMTTTSKSGNIGLEAKFGGNIQGGVDFTVNDVITTTGKWHSDNLMNSILSYTDEDLNNNTYEPYYFKQVGEMCSDNEVERYNKFGKSEAIQVKLTDNGGLVVRASDKYETRSKELLTEFSNTRAERRSRTQPISIIKASEYESMATDPGLYDLFSGKAEPYHIAEIKATKTDGSRYIYGIPVYNTLQQEVSFNASNLNVDCENGLVTYDNDEKHNTVENSQGVDGFFSRTTLPPYAHSYLLTAVLSADYVDVSPVGPGEEDLGTYVEFSYSKKSDYGWRMPYEENQANFNEGLYTVKGNFGDDKGSYLYGQKEMYYLRTITTKNYIAIFDVTSRTDAFQSQDDNGGMDQNEINKSQKLDKITLYTREAYGQYGEEADPIKVVHFEYEDDPSKQLCRGIPNSSNNGGKLTLNKVYFTYGKSNKGKISPYKFTYDEDNNRDYSHSSFDRWGNYKERPLGSTCGANGLPTNQEYPYVDQPTPSSSNTNADDWSASWTMNEIKLPSGGIINIIYEADDYAFVQDKASTQMFKITGIGPDKVFDFERMIPFTKNDGTHKIYIELSEGVASDIANPSEYFFNKYLKGLDWIYFRTMIKVNKSSKNNGYEYVSGYGRLRIAPGEDNYGLCNIHQSLGEYRNGYFELEFEKELHPFSQAAVQFARIYTPQKAYGYDFTEDHDFENVLKGLVDGGFVSGALEAFSGSNNYLFDNKGLGRDIKLNKSWVKLLTPNKNKLGGGSRVKELGISDNWARMEDGGINHPSYSQVYEYTKQLSNGDVISSGVASYEPAIGNDENPLKKPVFNGDYNAPLAPDDRYYQEEPYGESFFPGPVVGYSKVTVTSFTPTEITKHATGRIENEFYTAKDYPVHTERTDLEVIEKQTGFLSALFSQNVKDYMTTSQGFAIEVNDMHGKPKATRVFAEGKETPISGVDYYYKDNGQTVNGQRKRGDRLVNEMQIIYPDGSVKQDGMVGLDYDFVNDFRQQETMATNIGAQGNLYWFMVWVIPIFLPAVWPTVNKEQTRFRSASTTKVINRYGILDEVVAWDQNSIISSKVLALDAVTGEAVLNHTVNEYEDEEYTLNYPAHWIYKGMGPAYAKEDLKFIASVINGGKLDALNDIQSQISNGDELIMDNNVVTETVWVIEDIINSIPVLQLVDEGGIAVQDGVNYSFRMKRPGNRNLLNASVGSLVTRKNPIDVNKIGEIDKYFGVVDASSSEFTDDWSTFCDCNLGYGDEGNSNPFLRGLSGQWRPIQSYYYDTERSNMDINNSLRTEGTFEEYRPMWGPPSQGDEWIKNMDNWKSSNKIENYSPYGHPIEEVNSIGIYSSALYGYNHSLPIAVVGNAERREIAFENFEDYDDFKCTDGHFNFYEFSNKKSNDKAHSGKYSIKLAPETIISVTRNLNGCNK